MHWAQSGRRLDPDWADPKSEKKECLLDRWIVESNIWTGRAIQPQACDAALKLR
jgi:hypothetical protein